MKGYGFAEGSNESAQGSERGDEAKTEMLSAREWAGITHMQGKLEEESQMALPAHNGRDYIVLRSIKASGALSSDSTATR